MNADDLHVIRIYQRLPPQPGGMEQHVAQLTAAQRSLGVRVTEVYNQGQPEGEALRLLKGIDLSPIRPGALGDLMFYASAVARSGAIARDGRLRVVHVHGDWSSFILTRYLAKAIGAKAIAVSIHDRLGGSDRLLAASLRHCDCIFATGLADVKRMSRITGKKVIHLPSAPRNLFFDRTEAKDIEYDVLAIGNLVARKRIPILLECAALRPKLRFAIAGDGPERPALEAEIAAHGLKNVRLLGALSPLEVREALHRSRLFLNTSASEGSPTAALEAMACGLPVVLTPSNDYSSIVRPGENGQVTQGWDPLEICAAIDLFVNDGARLAAASACSRSIAEGHRWSRKAETVTAAMLAAARRR